MSKRLISIIAILSTVLLAVSGCAGVQEAELQPTSAPVEETAAPVEEQQTAASQFVWGEENDQGEIVYTIPLEYFEKDDAPEVKFTTFDIDGNEVDSGELFAGAKVTMLNVWGTYCLPCLMEMPDLGGIAAEYAGNADFQIVGIVCDVYEKDSDTADLARSQIQETGAGYLHLGASKSVINDLMIEFRVASIPTTMFINSEGRLICSTVLGSKNAATWKTAIEEVLSHGEE